MKTKQNLNLLQSHKKSPIIFIVFISLSNLHYSHTFTSLYFVKKKKKRA